MSNSDDQLSTTSNKRPREGDDISGEERAARFVREERDKKAALFGKLSFICMLARDSDLYHPIIWAVRWDLPSAVEKFLDYGVEFGKECDDTPGAVFCSYGYKHVLESTVDFNTDEEFSYNEAHLVKRAVYESAVETLKFLITTRGFPASGLYAHEESSRRKRTALYEAVVHRSRPRLNVVSALLDAGAELSPPRHECVLQGAVSVGQFSVLTLFAERGVDLTGFSLVKAAIRSNQVGMLKFLLKFGADIQGIDASGYNALHTYVVSGRNNSEILSLLRENCVDPHQLTADGFSPFLLACKEGNMKKIEAIYGLGVDVNNAGFTNPLFFAAESHRSDLVLFLHSKKVDMRCTNQTGGTALMALARGPQVIYAGDKPRETMELLIQLGVPVDHCDCVGDNLPAILIRRSLFDWLAWLYTHEAECGVSPARLKELVIVGSNTSWAHGWNLFLERMNLQDVEVDVHGAKAERQRIIACLPTIQTIDLVDVD